MVRWTTLPEVERAASTLATAADPGPTTVRDGWSKSRIPA